MTTTTADAGPSHRAASGLRDGAVTLALLLLAHAALDDITTDTDSDFKGEYGALLLCGAWLSFVTVRLLRSSRVWLGAISLTALAAAVWVVGRGIGPGSTAGPWAQAAMAGAWVWFMAVAIGLLVSGWRGNRR